MIEEKEDETDLKTDIDLQESFSEDDDKQVADDLNEVISNEENDMHKSINFNDEDTFKEDLEDTSQVNVEENDEITQADDIDEQSISQEEDTSDLVNEYLENVDLGEDTDTTNNFELTEFEYTLKGFDIAVQEYEHCNDKLDEYGYVFLSDKSDLKSKYFADQLLQYIDKYGKMQKSELTFCENQNADIKNDFIDLKNYFLKSVEKELLVLDLCKFGHVQKEYFLNSFYDFIKKDGNKIKFRELLARRHIKLILITYDDDIENKDDLFNIYKVKEDLGIKERDISEDNTAKVVPVSDLLSDETDNTIEKALLFIVSLFKECTPMELQSMLYLILDEEDTVRWKKERKKLLGNVHIVSKSELGSAAAMEFSSTLKGREVELLEIVRAEDPFFVLEFFDLFESKETLLAEVLIGKKSQAFTNGFFQLVKVVSLDEPDKLSLDWFIDKFENTQNYSLNYFFALASCALQVSKALNNQIFLDNLVNYFYERKALLPLLYLVEYFTYVDTFDKFKWYKKTLTLLKEDQNKGKLFSLLYKAIQKEVNADSETISTILSWRDNDKVANGYVFKILTRLASDSVRDNKDWSSEDNRMLPFLFTVEEDDTFNANMGYYLDYLFDFQEILKSCNVVIISESIAENINKLFFTKIIGLLRLYVDKSEQKSIIKTITGEIQKLIGDPEKTYILYKILLILEWSFLLNRSMDIDSATRLKRNIFSIYSDNLTKDELKVSRNSMQVLANLFLKLSSQTRKNRVLSGKYTMLRKDIRSITQDINKKREK